MTRVLALLATVALATGCTAMDRLKPQRAENIFVSSGDVLFSHTTTTPARAVYLAGDFNAWDPNGIAMQDHDGNGTWGTTQALYPGDYNYQFIEVNDPWRSPGEAWGRHATATRSEIQTVRVAGVRGW